MTVPEPLPSDASTDTKGYNISACFCSGDLALNIGAALLVSNEATINIMAIRQAEISDRIQVPLSRAGLRSLLLRHRFDDSFLCVCGFCGFCSFLFSFSSVRETLPSYLWHYLSPFSPAFKVFSTSVIVAPNA